LRFRGIPVIAAIVMLAGCGGGGGGGASAIVTGKVVQSTTLLPIEGAVVRLSGGGIGTTDAAGDFSITAGSLGAQTLTVSAADYEDAAVSITVQAGTNALPDPVKLVVAGPDLPPPPPGM